MGTWGCKPPEVPTLTRVNWRNWGFSYRVAKSILARASSSLTTMSILSVRCRARGTSAVSPYRYRLWYETPGSNLEIAGVEKRSDRLTRPGSPTRITLSLNCSGSKCRWNALPSALIINSRLWEMFHIAKNFTTPPDWGRRGTNIRIVSESAKLFPLILSKKP